ncbi:hypothetical protein N431DRAFT_462961 [Stipitochalara longipes BDJ]|nr:hypothetical protein N431DRAFT_462961 [Stipitochalara longipes BDJ]
MSKTQEKDAEREENKAVRAYLDTQVIHWFFYLWDTHGVRFNEIYEALVHYREPWVEYSVLRSAQNRWKSPGPQLYTWKKQQGARTPGFVIPPPPIPTPQLQRLLGLVELKDAGLVVKVGHLSLPSAPRPPHPDREKQYPSDPSSFMRTSHMGHGMTYASRPQTELFSPYNTGRIQQQQQQQHNQMQISASNYASPPVFQAPLPALPQYHPPAAEVAQDCSMEDSYNEPEKETICDYCRKVIGGKCKCPAAFQS